jgi:hypothetical protein
VSSAARTWDSVGSRKPLAKPSLFALFGMASSDRSLSGELYEEILFQLIVLTVLFLPSLDLGLTSLWSFAVCLRCCIDYRTDSCRYRPLLWWPLRWWPLLYVGFGERSDHVTIMIGITSSTYSGVRTKFSTFLCPVILSQLEYIGAACVVTLSNIVAEASK